MLPTLNFVYGVAILSGVPAVIPETAYPLDPDQDHWPGTYTDMTTPLLEIPTGSASSNIDCKALERS